MSRFTRLTRFALFVVLAATLAWPQLGLAAVPHRHEPSASTAAHGWLVHLWAPLKRLFLAGRADVAPTMDPDGLTGATDSGSGAGVDDAPTMDPDGATGSSEQEGDEGPTMDPDG